MKRIKRFNVYQTSKVSAVILFFVAIIFMIPFGLMSTMLGGDAFPGFPFGGLFLVFVPFIYGIIGFIMTAVSCLIYNLVAKWTGGIELEFEVMDEN
ncbi:MAG: hypothetical protein GXO79_11315 [Chlorobi bacterium]|nr:hypothetical protein [Chlorobiota bacterium]